MFSWFWKKAFPKYRIRHVEGVGYTPEIWELSRWWAIDRDGTVGVYWTDSAKYKSYYHETEEQAGKIINKHSKMIDSKVIWTG